MIVSGVLWRCGLMGGGGCIICARDKVVYSSSKSLDVKPMLLEFSLSRSCVMKSLGVVELVIDGMVKSLALVIALDIIFCGSEVLLMNELELAIVWFA